MLSKNNRKEQLLKQEPKKQRFAIKKLTIGVASVLIGFTFMGTNASADATTDTHSNTANQEAIQTNIDSGSKTLNNEQTNSSNSVANGSTNNGSTISGVDIEILLSIPISDFLFFKLKKRLAL